MKIHFTSIHILVSSCRIYLIWFYISPVVPLLQFEPPLVLSVLCASWISSTVNFEVPKYNVLACKKSIICYLYSQDAIIYEFFCLVSRMIIKGNAINTCMFSQAAKLTNKLTTK